MPAITLAALHPGDIATISSIHAEEALHLRPLALDFRTGKQIGPVRWSPGLAWLVSFAFYQGARALGYYRALRNS